MRQRLLDSSQSANVQSFPKGSSPWGSTPENLWEGPSPGTAAHTLPATPAPPGSAALASNPYKPTSSAHSQVQIHSPCRLSSVLPPCCVSLYLSTSPPLSVLVSRCLWPRLCVSVSLAPSLCPWPRLCLCVSPSPSPPALCSTSRKGHTPSLGSPSWAGLVTAREPDREAGTGEVDTARLGTPLRNRGQTAGGKWEGHKFGRKSGNGAPLAALAPTGALTPSPCLPGPSGHRLQDRALPILLTWGGDSSTPRCAPSPGSHRSLPRHGPYRPQAVTRRTTGTNPCGSGSAQAGICRFAGVEMH